MKKIFSILLVFVLLLGVGYTIGAQANTATQNKIVAAKTKKTNKKQNTMLKMKLATRSGPGTKFTSTGTFPKATSVKAIEKYKHNGTVWVLVEFKYKKELYRAYTGEKRFRISTSKVPTTQYLNKKAVINTQTDVFYGPGSNYKKYKNPIIANTEITVVGVENGFAHIDYSVDKSIRRAYIPESNVIYK